VKIRPEHIEHIRAAIVPLDTPEKREQYRALGLSDTRYGWGLLYDADLTDWIIRVVYRYANDAHIDTALRHIIPSINARD